MEYVVLAAAVIAALVIGVDAVRQRRHRRTKPHAGRIVAERIQASSGGPDVQALLGARRIAPPSAAKLETAWRPVAGPADTSEGLKQDGEAGIGGIWDGLARALDPESFRPMLAPGVEVVVFRLRWGDDYAMIATPDGTVHYQIEPWEAELVERMDGTRTVSELIVERLRADGDMDPGAVISLVDLLRTSGFLGSIPLDFPSLVRDRLDPASPARRRLREFGKTLRLPWHGAERFTKAAYRAGLGLAFRPIGLSIVVTLALIGLAAFVAVVRSGRFELELQAAPAEAAILLALGFVLTFAHELGHALTLVHYDRRVLSAGFFIFFGSPAFFVDASDVLMLDGRRRIVQAAAGALAELFLAGIASILLFLFPSTSIAGLMYRFAFINYVVILENLVPLLRLDGYWILVDLIQVPDLRSRSLAFLQSDVWHKLRKRERFTVQEVGLGLYGIVGFAYTVFSFAVAIVFWNLLFGDIVKELWRGGVGSRLLLLLLVIFFGGPIIRAGVALLRAIWKRLLGYLARIRFRFEWSWRIEAAELIDDLPAFEDLPEELLSSLAGRVRLRALAPGHTVFRQGDRAEAFYLIRSGTVHVEEEDPETGDTRVVRAMGRGDSFGELALLESAPRAATVRAVNDVQLFEVGKATFDRLLYDEMQAPSFEPTLQSLVELRSLPPFKRLPTEELLQVLDHGGWSVHPPGTAIIQQGESGDGFYAIGSGRADVDRDGHRISTLGPGDHFGELALLDDAPRSASVIARTHVRVFRLDREGFDGVIASSFRRGALRRTERDQEH